MWSNSDSRTLLVGVLISTTTLVHGLVLSGKTEVPVLLWKFLHMHTWNLTRMLSPRWIETAPNWSQLKCLKQKNKFSTPLAGASHTAVKLNITDNMDKSYSQNASDRSKSQKDMPRMNYLYKMQTLVELNYTNSRSVLLCFSFSVILSCCPELRPWGQVHNMLAPGPLWAVLGLCAPGVGYSHVHATGTKFQFHARHCFWCW